MAGHPAHALAVPGHERETVTDELGQRLVVEPVGELEVQAEAAKSRMVRPAGPALLYITPAWPRPVVSAHERFGELKALAGMAVPEIQVFGTEATTAELRDWWNARGLSAPPLALLPASAQRLGVHHLPLAIVVNREGRVAWVKAGYTPGDEAEWRRELERADR